MRYKNNIGDYASMDALWEAHPSGGIEGDYCTVDGVIYYWSVVLRNWETPEPKHENIRQTHVVYGDMDVHHDLHVGGVLNARVVRGRNAFCGLFASEVSLNAHVPEPYVGQWALVAYDERPVGDIAIGEVYVCETEGTWIDAGYKGGWDDEGLLSEKDARIQNDAALQEMIEENAAAIEAEAQAREQADTALGGRIDNEAQAREDADTALGGRIDNEAQAREDADTALGGRIDDEAQAREDADTELGGRIDDEAQSREQADTELGGRIDDEAQAREDADTELGGRIDNEAQSREQADTALGGRIDNEAQAREDADTELGGRIDDEAQSREQADEALGSRISEESNTRQQADRVLQEYIDEEAAARQVGDNALHDELLQEKVGRQDAERRLQQNIDTEVAARQQGDTALQVIITEKDYAVITDEEMDAVLGD